MRNPNLECLLCLQNKATKRNSHIIPKFITKSLLGQAKVKRVYTFGTNRMDKPPKFSQDTDKEDYILCECCEKYFSILEGYIATNLHNRILDANYADQFTSIGNGGMSCKVCEQIDPIIFRLFVYSIVWRCSISTTNICQRFNLEVHEAESLRNVLFNCKYEKEQELIVNILRHSATVPLYPFVLCIANEFDDTTQNTVFLNPSSKNPYDLILNQYMLIFSFKLTKEQEKFNFLNNYDKSKIKIGIISKDGWEKLRYRMIQVIVKKASDTLKSEEKITWVSKSE